MNIQTPAARNTDPQSSHIAAENITKSGRRVGQQAQVAQLVRLSPGSTSAELSRKTKKLDRYQIARRLPELKGVRKGVPRHCGISKQLCETWWPNC